MNKQMNNDKERKKEKTNYLLATVEQVLGPWNQVRRVSIQE